MSEKDKVQMKAVLIDINKQGNLGTVFTQEAIRRFKEGEVIEVKMAGKGEMVREGDKLVVQNFEPDHFDMGLMNSPVSMSCRSTNDDALVPFIAVEGDELKSRLSKVRSSTKVESEEDDED